MTGGGVPGGRGSWLRTLTGRLRRPAAASQGPPPDPQVVGPPADPQALAATQPEPPPAELPWITADQAPGPRLVQSTGGSVMAGSLGAHDAELVHLLVGPVTTLGRGPGADVIIPEPAAAEVQLRLVRTEDGRHHDVEPEPEGMHVLLNGSPLQGPARCEDGYRLEVGEQTFVYRNDVEPEDRPNRQGGEGAQVHPGVA